MKNNQIEMAKNFNEWILNESNKSDDIRDILIVLDSFKDAPMRDILSFRDSILDIVSSNESLNENYVTDQLQKLKFKFKRWIDDSIWNWIINRKKDFYTKLATSLNIFDLTTLDDVFANYPGLKLESIYLAGGMDKSKDVGAGWRNELEYEFDVKNKCTGVDPSIETIKFGEAGVNGVFSIEPCRIVDDYHLVDFLKNPSKVKKLYAKPLLLNPVRKELDRTKNQAFSDALQNYKTFTHETDPEDYEPTFTDLKKTMSSSIEPDDEHLVRISDAIFLGLNEDAASGTYGELQMQSFLNRPVFVWMTLPTWDLKNWSVWSFPHVSKFARNEAEMKILVKTICDATK